MNKTILWDSISDLNKNKIELDYILNKEHPEFIGICKTWLKNKDELTLKYHQVIRKDRLDQIGRGLAFCIKN